ncbi:MAG: BtpA family membrane complex biogenesis protein [Anaerolineae bacterium]|nr:BtpA/SgcQ family protein [Anaerolineales bacterium]MCQ3978611.1 BtpA family membrane complex biogenesis protein [Anaerolineae bacterium]
MSNFLKDKKTIIGMIHVEPLPGTPKHHGQMLDIITRAKVEAVMYKEAGVDAIAIENMHDIPYLNKKVGPEITAAMAVVGYEVKNATGLPCGVQVLAGANKEALAVALAAGLDFIRAEGFVFGHVADEGYIDASAGEVLRYRRQIGAEHILVLTDIKKKHSAHAVTADVDIIETAHAAEFFLSDGVIITGVATGQEASLEELQAVKAGVKIPVLVGSGVTVDNVDRYLAVADALIIGSYFKVNGHWTQTVDFERVKNFMEQVNKLR